MHVSNTDIRKYGYEKILSYFVNTAEEQNDLLLQIVETAYNQVKDNKKLPAYSVPKLWPKIYATVLDNYSGLFSYYTACAKATPISEDLAVFQRSFSVNWASIWTSLCGLYNLPEDYAPKLAVVGLQLIFGGTWVTETVLDFYNIVLKWEANLLLATRVYSRHDIMLKELLHRLATTTTEDFIASLDMSAQIYF